jgi:hypothetical protein
MLLNSQCFHQGCILAVDINTGSLAPITPVGPQETSSFSLAAIAGKQIGLA